jgi:hypothetical protein
VKAEEIEKWARMEEEWWAAITGHDVSATGHLLLIYMIDDLRP